MALINVSTFKDGSVQFHLSNGKISYIMMPFYGKLLNLYVGAPLPDNNYTYLIENTFRVLANLPFEDGPGSEERLPKIEQLRQEFPEYGRGDYRIPAITVLQENGSRISDFQYMDYVIYDGKKKLEGLPSTYITDDSNAQTLEITLVDEVTGLWAILSYTIFSDIPLIAKSVRIEHHGQHSVQLQRIYSATFDLPDMQYNMSEFMGAWARERYIYTQPLHFGIQAIGSTRGASSHFSNPTAIFARPDTTQTHGQVFGISFIYSGNFDIHAEVDTYEQTRIQVGINALNFSWHLNSGEIFQSPEALLGFSEEGYNGLSNIFHRTVREHIINPYWSNHRHPILINNWEATYYDFTEESLLQLAATSNAQGVELFVLDDGWFGARMEDNAGLGDWQTNLKRLPSGIASLARKIHNLDMKFGLWFEPEMVNKQSNLYRSHPDWVLHTPNRGQSVHRYQYVLNFARQDVVDEIFTQIAAIIRQTNLDYIKWDMNRFITEAFDNTRCAALQGEVQHRYILGVYNLYERLLEAFPHLLIEGCASGGGRFDMGMLAYSPQIWTSDNTDAIERLYIQWGTSYMYPLATQGAHVSTVPNHQTGRIVPLATRAVVAFFGTFGYELDLNALSDLELEQVRMQIQIYKEYESLIREGRYYRLISPFSHDRAAWMCVSQDCRHAIVAEVSLAVHPNKANSRLQLEGLLERSMYCIRKVNFDSGSSHRYLEYGIRSGAELMRIGIQDSSLVERDYQATLFVIDSLD